MGSPNKPDSSFCIKANLPQSFPAPYFYCYSWTLLNFTLCYLLNTEPWCSCVENKNSFSSPPFGLRGGPFKQTLIWPVPSHKQVWTAVFSNIHFQSDFRAMKCGMPHISFSQLKLNWILFIDWLMECRSIQWENALVLGLLCRSCK